MRPQVRERDLRTLTDTGKPGWLMSTDANSVITSVRFSFARNSGFE